MTTLITESGREKVIPEGFNPERIEGLDEDGRIVINDFDARNAEATVIAGYTQPPFMFGLTLCCNAYDKGGESSIYCRACYGGAPNADEGNYLFRAEDGSFPGLDPIAGVRP